ncbi:aminotransferase class V-fold PLP-dependent enzyme [Ferrimonas sp. SCSIO 43195]|uniref:aminotransferase class V-fold PLP-dependent enzyme n=1 Tax=Ferrimonas sp. SCSIO 43195 TaxID=2822844 RepID=UPI0020760EDC|nr:aminotransferase class V-fold PLP-dependent enzyme [Ferrimonas sp. SCSIO 43195]USD39488.1 aminotransferase class V-fold PLP-dependent enzyme [Ferrimonas sp. SCSIO 43195]
MSKPLPQFVPIEGIYLLNHSVGRPLASTAEALQRGFLDHWQQQSEPWQHWLRSIDEFNQALAGLLGGRAEQFCPQTNLSSGFTKLLFGLSPDHDRNQILLSEDDFPSMAFVAEQARANGYELKFMPAGSELTDLEVWQTHIDERVGLALVTHVQSNTGMQVPVARVCRLLRQHGVTSVVDVAQSIGCLPINLDDWQADVVLGSCVKWLCGGPGAGFIWVNDPMLPKLQPKDVGWFSHRNPFEFDVHKFDYHPGANRLWGGTPSVVPFVTAANSIRVLTEVGIDAIRQHNLALTQSLIDGCDDSWIASPKQANRRGGTVVIQPPQSTVEAVIEELQRQQVHFDRRDTGLRLSPHLYNTEQEIDQVLACLHRAGQ